MAERTTKRRGAHPVWLMLPVLAGLAGCAGLGRDDQGVLQPQTVRGPCEVKKFFLLGFTAVHTTMTVSNTGESCVFTMLDPNLQVFPAAVLVSTPARHGTASAGLAAGGRSPVISYVPAPGYAGPDRFTVTIEPNDHAVTVDVAVAAPAAAH